METITRPPCRCDCSSGIHDELTFGRGKLDEWGFWEKPCLECARWHEQKAGVPHNTYWPFHLYDVVIVQDGETGKLPCMSYDEAVEVKRSFENYGKCQSITIERMP